MLALIDNRGITIIDRWPVAAGLLAGLVMGDLQFAVVIARTFRLMNLGVAALGGSSVPDCSLAIAVAICSSVHTRAEIEASVTVDLPVDILAVNLNISSRTINSFVFEKFKQYLEERKFSKMQWINFISVFFVAMQAFVPIVILVVFGQMAIKTATQQVPKWVTNGLNVAGGMLPVVGVAMLIHYMPTKRYIWALLIGFIMAAYMELPILVASAAGLALAVSIYNNLTSQKVAVTTEDAAYDEGDDFDE